MAQWIRLCAPDAGGPVSIPDQGTRSHMSQLRVHMPQLRSLPAATKTRHNQIKKYKTEQTENKGSTLVEDVDSGAGCACVEAEGVWNSTFYSIFLCI